MTAQEFIKQYGWGEAKRILHDARGCASVRLYDKYEFSTDDLKQLVDAWELIENFGGLFSLVCTIDKECPCPEFGQLEYYDENRNIVLVDMPKIEQAIELVESVK